MIPVYLTDMEALKQSDAVSYGEFPSGNWVVNKNQHVPFCAVGADHALEHINRSMEVSAGLVGITLNPSARTVMGCSTWSPIQSCLRKCPQTCVDKASLGNSCLMILSQVALSQIQPTCGKNVSCKPGKQQGRK